MQNYTDLIFQNDIAKANFTMTRTILLAFLVSLFYVIIPQPPD
jgi:hypothetical protein